MAVVDLPFPSPDAGWVRRSPLARAEARLANARHELRRFQQDCRAVGDLVLRVESAPVQAPAGDQRARQERFNEVVRSLEALERFAFDVATGTVGRSGQSITRIRDDLHIGALRYLHALPQDYDDRTSLAMLDEAWTLAARIGGVASWGSYLRMAHDHYREARDPSHSVHRHLQTLQGYVSRWQRRARSAVGEVVLMGSFQARSYHREVEKRFHDEVLLPVWDRLVEQGGAFVGDTTSIARNDDAAGTARVDLQYERDVLQRHRVHLDLIEAAFGRWIEGLHRDRDALWAQAFTDDALGADALGTSAPDVEAQAMSRVEHFAPGHPSFEDGAAMGWQRNAGTVVVMVGHEDDFNSKYASTTIELRRQGRRVVVLVMTDGSAGTPQNPDYDGASIHRSFPDVRLTETLTAMRQAGVDDVVFAGFGDSGMAVEPSAHDFAFSRQMRDDPAGVISHVHRLLSSLRPSMVLLPQVLEEQRGNYEHPDHVATYRVGLAVVQGMVASGRPAPAVFALSMPEEVLRQDYDTMFGEVGHLLGPVHDIAPGASPTNVVEVGPHAAEMARRSLAAFRSQVVLPAADGDGDLSSRLYYRRIRAGAPEVTTAAAAVRRRGRSDVPRSLERGLTEIRPGLATFSDPHQRPAGVGC